MALEDDMALTLMDLVDPFRDEGPFAETGSDAPSHATPGGLSPLFGAAPDSPEPLELLHLKKVILFKIGQNYIGCPLFGLFLFELIWQDRLGTAP